MKDFHNLHCNFVKKLELFIDFYISIKKKILFYNQSDPAESEYLTALYKGELLTEEEKDRILDRLTYFTGLSRDVLLAHD